MKIKDDNMDSNVASPGSDLKPNLKGDYKNVFILSSLYILQGVPMGLTNSMKVMLQNRGVSYADQTIFYTTVYPFMLKVLWAPIVDCVFSKAFGRRKTWLFPTQTLIGCLMIYLSQSVDSWFGDEASQKPNIILITTVFFFLWILTATQDIAVDGWALTMLQKRNVGHLATINCVGQSFGVLLGFTVFLALESKDFCNKWIFSEPRDEGLVKFSGFLAFWGVTFLTVTFFITFFKKEYSENKEELKALPDFGIRKAYPLLWKIIQKKPILLMAAFFSTVGISTAARDTITNLKLIDYGIPRDKIGLLNIPSFAVQLTIPILLSRYTAGRYPMTVYYKAFPYRVIISVMTVAFVYATPMMIEGKLHDIPSYYYVTLMILTFFYQITVRAMYTADMSFFARVADPLVGGTYMTLMNISYIGGYMFETFSIWFVDVITWRSCHYSEDISLNHTQTLSKNTCADDNMKRECIENGGNCQIDIDGFYLEVVFNVIFAFFWFQWAKRLIKRLQELPIHDWHVLSK
ncbi:CLUMA_CG009042, isoform A [Clunio marinus]|uniref:CLUMA_CG009042, isoform A n=1 Tax=Clunio marinus TaxID=568069 RepID=A0A1J1I5L6_9DIPT|nr:CLUMA_CG009042, isoform A [Clunio marinus]